MREGQPQTIYLKDYQAPDWQVDSLSLVFELGEEGTLVTGTAAYRLSEGASPDSALELSGEALELVDIRLDDQVLAPAAYTLVEGGLVLHQVPAQFTLAITTRIHPEHNTSLEGLYRSSGNFCTQCEAQGFRKITYYQDRPDVLTVFSTRIIADPARYPVLLSNGNLTGSGTLPDGRHWAQWEDPYRKPSYLFALVAGRLEQVEDHYTTCSGREVVLRIYTEAHNIDKCGHAMASLKRAMRWDEERFGLAYDLDIYMIVAVDDFNMGAMENKGLNIFNSKLVFASPETATDMDYINIESVIGHEYFHNWTGNRVTCRDWFQLSLKEGLTVFRDQEFTADLHSRAVKRIEDVRMLRTHQFAEDASPMAHPVRPASYIEINNFYTVTVYEKGAEVVRLYDSLLGQAGFRRGMDLYFERHDGQAVTTEDFLAAMADANGVNLDTMHAWYNQPGTPEIQVDMDYDPDTRSCTLHCRQVLPEVMDGKAGRPYLIPLALGLLDAQGQALALELADPAAIAAVGRNGEDSLVLRLEAFEQSFTFMKVPERPVPSLLRGFSAPVRLNFDYDDNDLLFLMRHDTDAFNRWDAGQRLAMQTLLNLLEAREDGEPLGLEHDFISAFQAILTDETLDHALRAEALTLPSVTDMIEVARPADPAAIHEVREYVLTTLARSLRLDMEHLYQTLADDGAYRIDAAGMGRRRLRNVCLGYLGRLGDASLIRQAAAQYREAGNMTDALAALTVLADCDSPLRQEALQHFHDRWQNDTLVMDKWFALQASSTLPHTLKRVRELMQHRLFDIRNPNKVRALIGSFTLRNPLHFHAADGSGYRFLTEQVISLNGLNPQVAARMVRPLMNWRHFEAGRSALMRAELGRIQAHPALSTDVYEIVSKSLAD
ncbi:MAG: aminopeptidase N [Thiothrix sp.]|nr:aminopeptidase N [Thiothrix sp.]